MYMSKFFVMESENLACFRIRLLIAKIVILNPFQFSIDFPSCLYFADTMFRGT